MGQNALGDAAHDGGGEAAARADLQHPVARLELQEIDELSRKVNAFHDGAAFDRKGPRRPGIGHEVRGHEEMARRLFDRIQELGAGDAPRRSLRQRAANPSLLLTVWGMSGALRAWSIRSSRL